MKNPSKSLENEVLIDDVDEIKNPFLFYNLIFSFFEFCADFLKPKIIQDIYMLLKWNKNNCALLLNKPDLLIWLLDIMLFNFDELEGNNQNSNSKTVFLYNLKNFKN